MIINGDGGYRLLAAYIGGLAAQAGWLGPKVGGHLAPLLYSSREPCELSQWLCSYDDSTITIVIIIIIIILFIFTVSAKRGIAIVCCPSVCPSVRLSVCP